MATRYEIERALDDVQAALFAIVRKHALDIPACAVEEIAVYFVTKEVPTLRRLASWARSMSERAEDAAKEILEMLVPGSSRSFTNVQQVAGIIQRAMDDDYDDRLADAEGS